MKKTSGEVTVKTNGGIGVFGMLGVLFVALKLTSVIGWSWWWVTLPFWGGLAIVLAGTAIAAVIAVIIALVSRK